MDAASAALMANLPMVRRIAHKMLATLPASVEIDDLMQAGMIGLLEAVERYDPSRGASLQTYAEPRIAGAMMDMLRSFDEALRSDRSAQRRAALAQQLLEHRLGRAATTAEIAGEIGMSVEGLDALRYAAPAAAAMDDADGIDLIPACPLANPETWLELKQQVEAAVSASGQLSEREQAVLSMFYDDDMTQAAIAERFGVSDSRICQLRACALSKVARAVRLAA